MENKFKKYIGFSNKANKGSEIEKIVDIKSRTNTNSNSSFTINSTKKEEKNKNKNKSEDKINQLKKKFFITNDGQKGKNKNKKNKIKSASINRPIVTENNKINDSLLNANKKGTDDDDNDLYKETMLSIKNRTLNNQKLKLLQKKLRDLEFSKNHDKLLKTNGFNGKENLLINIKDIMKEIYIENPTSFSGFNKRKLYLTNPKGFNFETEKRKERPLTSTLPKVSYGENYEFISDKIMNDIDNMITKVNDIDLHDFTTDEKYKEKRNLNLFNKKPEEKKIERKNSIDSLLKEESGQSYEEEEITEEEEDDDDNNKE